MKTNIIIPVLHLFQVSLKFMKETRYFITVHCKPCKKKVIPLVIKIIPPTIEEEEEFYTMVDYLDYNRVNINFALLQTLKWQELVEIL